MEDVIQVIKTQIENTEAGKDVVFSFGGVVTIIDVEMIFVGGWVVKQENIPGKKLVFTKGNSDSLTDLTITFRPYDGLNQLEKEGTYFDEPILQLSIKRVVMIGYYRSEKYLDDKYCL